MKLNLYFTLTIMTLFLVGCNPFGTNSLISIAALIERGKTTTEINAGGKTYVTIPNSGLPSDIHTISYSVGTPFKQTVFTAGNGDSINVSISGAKRE